MNDTKLSFIHSLTDGSEQSWHHLLAVYSPLIRNHLRKFQFGREDVADIAQDVLIAVHKNIDGFEHNGRVGAFRNWVRTITVNKARSHLRKKSSQGMLSASDEIHELLNQLADESSQLTVEFNRQHDGFLLETLLKQVADECDPITIEVFRMYVLDEMDPAEIAKRRGIAKGVVYVAKSRVLRRLRELAEDFELV